MILWRISTAERLVTIRCTGIVTAEEYQRVFADLKAAFPEAVTFDSVNDLRAQQSALASAQVLEMGRFSTRLGLHEHARRSVTIVGDNVNFGISRMFEQLTEHEGAVTRLTTRSVATAAEWLGRPLEMIESELCAVSTHQEPQS